MYELRFTATDDADWSEGIELIDDTTNLALADAADATFTLEIKDCGAVALRASTDDATITKPAANIIRWRFTPAQLGSLCPGNTYKGGCSMTTAGGTEQLFTCTLALIDGGLV